MASTNDGFAISEEDLKIRGPGEFYGTRQSGMAGLKIADVFRDIPILEIARKEAFEIVSSDPGLSRPEVANLRRELMAKIRGVRTGSGQLDPASYLIDFGIDNESIYPGSFDPVTCGHVDIIERAARVFDEVVVAVGVNMEKRAVFSVEERIDLLRQAVAHLDNVEVDYFSGLLVEYVERQKARVIIKGLRAVSDFEFELQMALTNKRLNEQGGDAVYGARAPSTRS